MKYFVNLLVLSALLLQTLTVAVLGQSARGERRLSVPAAPLEVPAATDSAAFDEAVSRTKIAPDLEDDAANAFAQRIPNETRRVIIQLRSESGLNEQFGAISPDTRSSTLARENLSNRRLASAVGSKVGAMGGRVSRTLNNLGLVAAELPLDKIRELSENADVAISCSKVTRSNRKIKRPAKANKKTAPLMGL